MLAEPSQMSSLLQVGDNGVNGAIGSIYKENYSSALTTSILDNSPFGLFERINCLMNAVASAATPARIASSFENCGISSREGPVILVLEKFLQPLTYRHGTSYRDVSLPLVTKTFLQQLFSTTNLARPWKTPAYVPASTLSRRNNTLEEEMRAVDSLLDKNDTMRKESVVGYLIRRSAGQQSLSLNKFAYVLSTMDILNINSLEEGEEGGMSANDEEKEKNERVGRVSTEHGRLLTSENTMLELIEVEKRSIERQAKQKEMIEKREERAKQEAPLRAGWSRFTNMEKDTAMRINITKEVLSKFINAQQWEREGMPHRPRKYSARSILLESALQLILWWEVIGAAPGSMPYEREGNCDAVEKSGKSMKKEKKKEKEGYIREALVTYTSMTMEHSRDLTFSKEFLDHFCNAQPFGEAGMPMMPRPNSSRATLFEAAFDITRWWEKSAVERGSQRYRIWATDEERYEGSITNSCSYANQYKLGMGEEAKYKSSVIVNLDRNGKEVETGKEEKHGKIAVNLDKDEKNHESNEKSIGENEENDEENKEENYAKDGKEIIDLDQLDISDAAPYHPYEELSAAGKKLVDTYLIKENVDFPATHIPCGGHSLLHYVTVDAYLVENIINQCWMNSDCMDIVAGSLAVRYSGKVCLLTTGPSHLVSMSHESNDDRCQTFVQEAIKEITSIHHSLPLVPPLAVAMPVNISNSHWIAVVAFPSEKTVEYWDSLGTNRHGVCEQWRDYLQKLCEEMSWSEGVTKWKVRRRVVPLQSNGDDCGRFVLYNLQKLAKALTLVDTSVPSFNPRRVHVNFKSPAVVESLEGRQKLCAFVLEHVQRYIQTKRVESTLECAKEQDFVT